MQRYPVLDSEKLFDQCVYASGGTRVQDIAGRSPNFDNADYVFPADNVIAEFKSLQKDFLTAPDVARKMHLLFNKWVASGKVQAQYGHAIIRTDRLPLECARELIGLFKNRLEQPLKKANSQIAQTKERLKCADAIGLLILSNDGNYALDPEMTAHVLYHSLKEKYSSIEHVVVVAANVTTHIPGVAADVFPFISISIPKRRKVTDLFLGRLGTAWGEVLRRATGRSFETLPGPFRRLQREEVQTMRFYPADKHHVSC